MGAMSTGAISRCTSLWPRVTANCRMASRLPASLAISRFVTSRMARLWPSTARASVIKSRDSPGPRIRNSPPISIRDGLSRVTLVSLGVFTSIAHLLVNVHTTEMPEPRAINSGKPLQVTLTPARKAKLDEFGECDRQLKLWKPQSNPHRERYDELEAEILSWCPDLAADKSTVLSGRAYDIEVTEQGLQQKFSEEATAEAYRLLQAIKGLNLLQFFSVTLAEAKAHLGKAWMEKWVPKRQTGARSLKAVPRAEAVKKAA